MMWPEHPFTSVIVTVLPPAVVARIVRVVSPVLHEYKLASVAVKFTDPPAQNIVAPPGLIVGAGKAFTVTVVVDDVAEHPFTSVIVTVLPPEVVAITACVASPVLHEYTLASVAVKVTEPPAQSVVVPLGLIVGVGKAFTVTGVDDDVAEHPLTSVIVTVLPPEVVASTDCVVSPVLHEYKLASVAVKFTDPPAQNVVAPLGLIVGVGKAFTVTVVADDAAEHPFTSVMVTVLPPEVVASTDCVVSPVLHEYELASVAVKFTEPPAQNVVAPPGLIVDVGNAFIVAVTGLTTAQPVAAILPCI